MIKSLKAKFVAYNMIIVFLIITIAFLILYFSTAGRYYSESIKAMKRAVSMPVGMSLRVNGDDEEQYGLKAFYVVPNGNEYSLIGKGVSIEDEDEFIKIVDDCLSSNKKIGTVHGENLRYMVTDNEFGEVVAFADITMEKKALSQNLSASLSVGVAMLAVFFVISIFLSNWMVRPIKNSIEKQNRFIADASHELKTPITVILANTDIIASHNEETVETQKKWLSYIKNEAETMKGLVCDMLTLAKSDAEIAQEKYDVINISEIVNTVVLPFESLVFEKGKKFKYEIADDLKIKGNEKEIEKLTSILIDNAVKYSDENGEVDVYLFGNQNSVSLTVRNSGEPIPEDRISNIFDRFYRLDDARARQSGGFGLGLSIAKEIANKHGAKISVESNMQIGTAFTFTFKAA